MITLQVGIAMRKWILLLLALAIVLLPILECFDVWDVPWLANPGDLELPIQWYAVLLAYTLLQKLLLFLVVALCGGIAFSLRSESACQYRLSKGIRVLPFSVIPLRI